MARLESLIKRSQTTLAAGSSTAPSALRKRGRIRCFFAVFPSDDVSSATRQSDQVPVTLSDTPGIATEAIGWPGA